LFSFFYTRVKNLNYKEFAIKKLFRHIFINKFIFKLHGKIKFFEYIMTLFFVGVYNIYYDSNKIRQQKAPVY